MKKIFNLENYIYLVIILLPAYLVKFKLFAIPTNVLETLITIAFFWWLIETDFKQVFFKEIDKKIILSIGLVFLGLIISSLANKNYAVGFGIIKGWFVFPLLLTAIIHAYLPKEKMINVFKALYVSSFLVAFISLTYLFSGHVTYDLRLQAFFNSPNYLAMYLAPGIIAGSLRLNLWKLPRLNLGSGAALFSFVVILFSFYFTYSYASWVAMALALAIAFLLKNKSSKKHIIILALIAIALVFSLKNTAKFSDLASFNERSSLSSRMMIWKSAGKILQDNWLLGIGPGNFQEKYLEYQKYFIPYLEWAVPHPHNIFLAFWLYGGIMGFLGFIFLLFFWFKSVLKKQNSQVTLITLAVMGYILIHGLVDTTYFKNDLAIIFWLNFLVLKK